MEIVADAERVGAGRERAYGALLDSDAGADRTHLQRVGDHEPAEAELLAQQPGQDPAAQGRGRVVERRDEQVRGHHRLHVCRDCSAERQQRELEVALDGRQIEVRVDVGVAVPREVLRAGGDALALRALDERRDVTGDELRVGAEAAHADHRVVRVRVHVGDRREVQVDAGAGELGGDRRGDVRRESRIVDDPEREIAGERAACRGLEPA